MIISQFASSVSRITYPVALPFTAFVLPPAELPSQDRENTAIEIEEKTTQKTIMIEITFFIFIISLSKKIKPDFKSSFYKIS